ncbi:MAG: mechanosensitive ion channel family protein [Candidatus Sulfotelmatobacter sp.]
MDRDKVRRTRVVLLQKDPACLCTRTYLLSLVLLLCAPAWAQLSNPVPAPPAAQPELPKDALGRTTPQGTVMGFLIAARKDDNELAARYLNTRFRGERATTLARQLYAVLDRRLPPRLNQLSDKPEGSRTDLLNPEQELVGTINSDTRRVDIFVERVDRGKSGSVWLFSSKTLEAIPVLYEEINVVPVDSILPEVLVNARLLDIPLFEWLAAFVGMPLFYFLTVLLNRLLKLLVAWLRRRLQRKPNLHVPDILPTPVRLLLLAGSIHWTSSKVGLPLLARQFWAGTATVITIAASVWLLILFASWGEAYFSRSLRSRNLTGATSMLRLARWGVNLVIIFVGLLVTLHYFGVNPTGALAGLGVGGVAVALAAQKTLENVVGGISLIFDQAVHVGDSLKVGDTVGTVREIGFRSTRILTLDRTLVSVPNGQIATMTLENLSARDKFWLHPILGLRYDTSSHQMHALLDGIRKLLNECRHVEPNSVRVRFLRFGASSLDVEVFAYVMARDWSQFLEIQEELQLQMMECIESTGVQIALPGQNLQLSAPFSPRETGMQALLKTPTPETQPINEAAVRSA